jgi:large subunit ribosomal protein L31
VCDGVPDEFGRAPCTEKEAISLKHVHPELTLATVRCTSCGRTFVTRSTRDEIVVDVCSNCHPAYTGAERRVQSGSRIDRFERRRAAASR